MKSFLIVSIILVYVFSSAFLELGPAGRVTVADLLLTIIIFISALSFVSKSTVKVPTIYLAAVPMLLVFLIGAVFAAYPDRAAFELFIILFSFFGGIAILNLLLQLSDAWLKKFVNGYVFLIGLISFICLFDFFVMPGLISSRQFGGLQGTFRNTGQAGSFFGVHCVLVIALLLSNLVPRTLPSLMSAVFVLLALAFTLKRASIIAVVSGFVLIAVFMALSSSLKDKKIGLGLVVSMAFLALVGYFIFEWALDAIPGLRWRLEYKFSSETLESFEDGFLAENINSAFSALADRPLIGVGLDNVRDIYQSHEIHSTYLGILAYSGLVGTLAYAFFMFKIFRTMFFASRLKPYSKWAGFLYFLTPLLLGQMIGWGYTYHIRKREFWLLVLLVVVANEMINRVKKDAITVDKVATNRITGDCGRT